jgi:aminoglycoside 2'-N-acetyltransferase I
MSIEIEVLNGEHSRPQAETLFRQMEPHDAQRREKGNENEPGWAHITWADPDLRVMVDDPDSGLVCHAGIFFRTVTWNGQKVHVGGVGQVATHPGHRRRGYASIALEAAVQTMRHHDAAQFAVLFCESHNFAFYQSRGWHPFTGTVYAEQPAGKIRFEAMAPFVLDLKRRAPTLGTLDMCGLPW